MEFKSYKCSYKTQSALAFHGQGHLVFPNTLLKTAKPGKPYRKYPSTFLSESYRMLKNNIPKPEML